LTRSK